MADSPVLVYFSKHFIGSFAPDFNKNGNYLPFF